MAVLELRGRLPERLTLVGIEPESVELDLALSPPVAASLLKLVRALAAEL